MPFSSASIRRLISRDTSKLPGDRVFASDRPLWQVARGRKFDFSDDCIRWGTRDAKVVYSMFGNEWRFLKFAKASGLKIVLDVFIHPFAEDIIRDEMTRHPFAAGPVPTFVGQEPWLRTLFDFSDVLLCPSKCVAEGIAGMSGDYEKKIRVVPYGSSVEVSDCDTIRHPRRVLFAGSDFLRKGLVYLAEAANIVKKAMPDVDFRIAGLQCDQVPDQMPHKDKLNFLGRLPLSRMRDEFQSATAFVLPSLVEGQAGVVLEALACGAPVIATRESGVDLTEGVNGLVVYARDSRLLAESILKVVENPSLQASLGQEGRALIRREFSMAAWAERLERLVLQVICD